MLAQGALSPANAVLLLPRWPVTVPTSRKPQIRAARGIPLQIAAAPQSGMLWEIRGSIPGLTLFPRTGTARARLSPGSRDWPETRPWVPGSC